MARRVDGLRLQTTDLVMRSLAASSPRGLSERHGDRDAEVGAATDDPQRHRKLLIADHELPAFFRDHLLVEYARTLMGKAPRTVSINTCDLRQSRWCRDSIAPGSPCALRQQLSASTCPRDFSDSAEFNIITRAPAPGCGLCLVISPSGSPIENACSSA
jgi:hypothetical protein